MMYRIRRIIGFVCLFAFTVNAMAQNNGKDSVRIYRQRAREGEVLAYEKLASYYHDGVGVEHSFINMLAMYLQASERGGLPVEEYMCRYEEEDPDRLLFDAITDMEHKRMGGFQSKQDKLKAMSHSGYITLQALLQRDRDKEEYRRLLWEASEKGCSLGQFLYALSFENSDYEEEYEKVLQGLVRSTPMAYNLLGRLYWKQAEKTGEKVLMESAEDFFRKADRWAFLTKEDAKRLLYYYKDELDFGRSACNYAELKHLQEVACTDIGIR